MKTLSTNIDGAGTYRLLVEIVYDDNAVLAFDHEPTDEEIEEEVNKIKMLREEDQKLKEQWQQLQAPI